MIVVAEMLWAVPVEAQVCGDGVVEGSESCDPGGPLHIDGDTSNPTCTTGNDCFFANSCCKFNCNFVGNGAACDDGNECTETDKCQSEVCVGTAVAEFTACGDPTDTECSNPDSCDGAGACDPRDQTSGFACGDTSNTECTDPDTCDGAGTCQDNHALLGAPCGDQGIACRVDDTCDGLGTCIDNGVAPDATLCGDLSDTECTDPDTCLSGNCETNHAAPGAACGDQGVECLVDDTCDGGGSCTDNGFAANGSACGDQGVECLVDDTCDGAGTCNDNGFEPASTACGDGSDTECTDPDTCDGAGACQGNDAASGDPCGDQGLECLVDDTCDGIGSCTDNGFEAAATPCGDGSDTECTDPDSCDGAGACEDNHALSGDPCGDQGVDCLVDDTCDGSGSCTDNGFEAAATPCGDGSDTQCTDPDSCDGAGACEDNHALSGDPCGDQGVDCLVDDTCDGSGSCTDNGFEAAATPCGDGSDTECTDPDSCDGSGGCLPNHAVLGSSCGDTSDTDCTNPDTCDGGGICAPNHELAGTACTSDGVGCTDDDCDGAGTCAHIPVDAVCADGVYCNGDENCDPVADCLAGVPRDCDDGIACTADSCDEFIGSCINPPLHPRCHDTSFCNGFEQCDPGSGGCVAGAVVDCSHLDNFCTAASCSEAARGCVASSINEGVACDDGDACSFDDACVAGTCTGTEPAEQARTVLKLHDDVDETIVDQDRFLYKAVMVNEDLGDWSCDQHVELYINVPDGSPVHFGSIPAGLMIDRHGNGSLCLYYAKIAPGATGGVYHARIKRSFKGITKIKARMRGDNLLNIDYVRSGGYLNHSFGLGLESVDACLTAKMMPCSIKLRDGLAKVRCRLDAKFFNASPKG